MSARHGVYRAVNLAHLASTRLTAVPPSEGGRRTDQQVGPRQWSATPQSSTPARRCCSGSGTSRCRATPWTPRTSASTSWSRPPHHHRPPSTSSRPTDRSRRRSTSWSATGRCRALPGGGKIPRSADRIILTWRPGAMNWREEDEPVAGHPRDPHSRVEALTSSRHVVVAAEGTTLADGQPAGPALRDQAADSLLPPRSRPDAGDVLTSSDTRSHCPYKGVGRSLLERPRPARPARHRVVLRPALPSRWQDRRPGRLLQRASRHHRGRHSVGSTRLPFQPPGTPTQLRLSDAAIHLRSSASDSRRRSRRHGVTASRWHSSTGKAPTTAGSDPSRQPARQ